jgi:CheY-like chemotaxis protein
MPPPTARADTALTADTTRTPTQVSVLVVEDDDRIQRLVNMVLGGEGYRVIRADNGQEALERIDSEKPDAILLDLMLPVLDGWQLHERLRARADTASIPVVLMSASRNLAQTARKLGAAAYLAKPFGVDELVRVIRRQTAPRG